MSADSVRKAMMGFYVLLFFAWLFGPLLIMSASSFNAASFPTVTPWEGFTLKWFTSLFGNRDIRDGVLTSLTIGAGVVVVAVPIGLAAAVLMTKLRSRTRSIYYAVVVSPVLMPGVIIGVSTKVFWDRLGVALDAPYSSFFYDGLFLTVMGQASFISAYCMLIFLARLQRFDRAQEEAALDLGASHMQVFFKVLIPFLRPAILSAAVLAFLTSFENYNTTVFTILPEKTLTTVLASKVRLGTDPSISALAFLIIAVTIFGAILYEIRARSEARRLGAR
ncbi:MAG: ABC transporter permease [Paracoccaceae bacterium]